MRRIVWKKRIDCVSAVEFVLVLCRYTFNMANDCDDWWLTWKLQQSFPLFIYIFPSGIKLKRKRVYIREITLSRIIVCVHSPVFYILANVYRTGLHSKAQWLLGWYQNGQWHLYQSNQLYFPCAYIHGRADAAIDERFFFICEYDRFPHLSARWPSINLRKKKRQMFI